MDPVAVLERLLLAEYREEAADGGELTELDSASEALHSWLRSGGYPPKVTEEQVERLKEMIEKVEEGEDGDPGSDSSVGSADELAARLTSILALLPCREE